MGHVMMVISGQARPGQRDAMLELFETHLAERAVANDAQPVVVWATDDGDADRFHLVEIYDDPAALAANSQADWFWTYMAEAGELMASEPTVATCTPRWTKGVHA